MLSRTLGITALAAATASAVLIPPSVTAEGFGDDNAMEISVNPLKRTVAIECATCAFASLDGNKLSWADNAGSSFLLDFEVGSNEDTLDIDGVQLYPPSFGYFTEPFHVRQVGPASMEDLKLRVTGYTFHYNSAETITEAGIELLPMTFRITSIEGKLVDPPAVTVNLLKDTNGRLMIASFQTAKAAESSAIDQGEECKEWPLLCKWKSIVADRLHGLKSSINKGCHKNKASPTTEEAPTDKPFHGFRPGHKHHGPHHMGGHRHHAHHRMHMFVRRAFFTILLPILIGIFAGTLTYLIGMALGCLIAVVVAKVRGRDLYERIALEDDESADVEDRGEKEVYAELPEYDSPPVYEEAAEKEVVEESK